MPTPRTDRRRVFVAVLALAGALALAGCSSTASAELPAELAGCWSGRARVIVDWVAREHLDLELVVSAEGEVTGSVGDATLVGARMTRNRGWLGRALGTKTDWIVRGALLGELVAEEGVRREALSIPLNLRGGRLEGGLHSSGSKLAAASRGVLSAADLVLERR